MNVIEKDDNLLYIEQFQILTDKVAIFDLDHTLVKPKNNIHPKNANDFIILYDSVKKIKSLDYSIIIITNQLSASKKDFIVPRIKNILKEFNVPINVYISTGNDTYRKPNTDIFEKYIMHDKITSLFYVGDAAGRDGDFSDSDRAFALNIHLLLKFYNKKYDIKFFTPEKFFLGEDTKQKNWLGFDPYSFLKTRNPFNDRFKIFMEFLKNIKGPIVFILIGPPASGKSTLSKLIKKEFIKKGEKCIILNSDTIKNKCFSYFKSAISQNISIILDNTNGTKKVRQKYTENVNLPIYYLHMNTFDDLEKNRQLYNHLNCVRLRNGGSLIPKIAINTFYKNYEPPDMSELAIKIFDIPFIARFPTRRKLLNFVQRC